MSELSSYSSDFLSRLRSRLDSDSSTVKTQTSPGIATEMAQLPDPLMVAAAVQHVYTLSSLGGKPDAAFLRQLERDSVPAPGYFDSRSRILARNRRIEVLNAVRLEGARAALAALKGPILTPTQSMFEALLLGRQLELGALSRAQLVALREAERWVEGLMELPFGEEEIAYAITHSDVWSPFSHLLDESFVGRDGDMDGLARFIGLRTRRDGSHVPVRPSRERIVFVEGVGGIGKTALIAHFLARFRNADGGPRYPFAYLACDNPAFDITEIDLLQSAAAEQILRHVRLANRHAGLSAPEEVDAAHARFNARVRQQTGTLETATKRSSTAENLDIRLGKLREGGVAVTGAFVEFADLASRAMTGEDGWVPPCLIVIDTFEEVQYRSSARLLPFWRLIEQMLDSSESIRVVISGRPPLPRPSESFSAKTMPLKELSHEAAVDLLARESGLDTQVLDRLARQIGGNPLNLRLAARVVADETPGRYGIEGLSTRRWGFLRVSEELIRGQLYRRVLDHIHDPRVRALAHPGMVLRRITPEIIEEVLAWICDIDLAGPEDAEHLFRELSKEHTLVRLDDDQSLRYRDDVRRPVLELLANDQPELTRRAHEGAFYHYRERTDPVSAAEAIYHGLMLGLDSAALDGLWTKGVEEELGSVIDELPPGGKVWLASKMDISLPDQFYLEASVAEWERIIGPRALAVLQEVGSAEVLAILSERKERTEGSPLISIEARCLISLGDYAAAAELLSRALDDFPFNGNPGRKAEYLWLLAKSHWEDQDLVRAVDVLRDLGEVASSLTSAIPLVQCLSAALALTPADDPSAPTFRADLADALARCTDTDISREPDVIRRGFVHIEYASAGRLVRCALASLSGLYDIATRPDAFKPTQEGIDAILAIARQVEDRPGLEDLARGLIGTLGAPQRETSSFFEAFNVLHRPLANAADGSTDPAGALAAQVVWHLVQMETSNLSTATLAGIDDYRIPWEVETMYQAAVA